MRIVFGRQVLARAAAHINVPLAQKPCRNGHSKRNGSSDRGGRQSNGGTESKNADEDEIEVDDEDEDDEDEEEAKDDVKNLWLLVPGQYVGKHGTDAYTSKVGGFPVSYDKL